MSQRLFRCKSLLFVVVFVAGGLTDATDLISNVLETAASRDWAAIATGEAHSPMQQAQAAVSLEVPRAIETRPAKPEIASVYAERFANVTAAEHLCLAQAVYYEARGEPMAGQIAVAQVVLNRAASGRWSSNICSIVYQGREHGSKCQFSFACHTSKSPDPSGEVWDHAVWVAETVLSGGAWLAEMLHADHFHRTDLVPVWRLGLQRIGSISRHVFYANSAAIVDRTWLQPEAPPAPLAGARPAEPAPKPPLPVVTASLVAKKRPAVTLENGDRAAPLAKKRLVAESETADWINAAMRN